jgi:hypothetical protein
MILACIELITKRAKALAKMLKHLIIAVKNIKANLFFQSIKKI